MSEHSDVVIVDFSTALHALEGGSRIRNMGWNHDNSYLELQVPDDYSKMTMPYIYFSKACGDTPGGTMRVPWVASQYDLLSADWVIIAKQAQEAA